MLSNSILLRRAPRAAAILLLAGMLTTSLVVHAEDPLHVRIDKLVESSPLAYDTPLVDDAGFARRIHLDLSGSVPSVAQLRAFVADQSPNKREQLIDRLLQTPSYARHMATTFDVMLSERRETKTVKQDEWYQYLFDSFAQNKPWNQLASEVLGADGTPEKIRAASKYYFDREGEPNLLTRDVGRIFFGMDLGCCQCHDHPLVGAYRQSDYYGLFAFLGRGTLFTAKDKTVFFAEKADGDVKFTSVFTKRQDETRPRLPDDFEVTEPVYLKGEEYAVAPANDVRPIPKYSRRAKLAELLRNGTNRPFSRNIVNRLWAIMMGRGLVEPLDMHHVDNPASHPELLEMLTAEFVRMNFDIRATLHELALTKVYQRTLPTPDSLLKSAQTAAEQLAGLESRSQQVHETLKQTTSQFDEQSKAYDAARQSVTAVINEFGKANEAIASKSKSANDAAKALADAQRQQASKKESTAAVQDAMQKTAAAAARFKGGNELGKAAEIVRARAQQLTQELAAAEKLVADRTPAANSAAESLAGARKATEPILEKLKTTQQQLAAIELPFAKTQNQLQAEQVAMQLADLRVAAARSAVNVGNALRNRTASRKQLEDVMARVKPIHETHSTATAQLSSLEAISRELKSAAEATTRPWQAAQESITGKQQAAQLLQDAVAKIDLAVEKLPTESALKQAAATIRSQHQQILGEVEQTQKNLAELEVRRKSANERFQAAQQALVAARVHVESIQKVLDAFATEITQAKGQSAADDEAAQTALRQATEEGVRQLFAAPLDPLTPEQLAWSILTVTGMVEEQRVAAELEVNKAMQLDANLPLDASKAHQRDQKVERIVYDKLKGNASAFVNLFGHAGGQPQRDFFATADQALFFGNGGVLQSWLNPKNQNLLGRLAKISDNREIAAEFYLSILSRNPSGDELAAIQQYLANRTSDRDVALQELAWALITSIEFRFQ